MLPKSLSSIDPDRRRRRRRARLRADGACAHPCHAMAHSYIRMPCYGCCSWPAAYMPRRSAAGPRDTPELLEMPPVRSWWRRRPASAAAAAAVAAGGCIAAAAYQLQGAAPTPLTVVRRKLPQPAAAGRSDAQPLAPLLAMVADVDADYASKHGNIVTLSGYVNSLQFDGDGTMDRVILALAKVVGLDSPLLSVAIGLMFKPESATSESPERSRRSAVEDGFEQRPLSAVASALQQSPFALQVSISHTISYYLMLYHNISYYRSHR
eukprot:SAG31_NODE_1345_length_8699_cov_7.525116_7_plen_266_part_00